MSGQGANHWEARLTTGLANIQSLMLEEFAWSGLSFSQSEFVPATWNENKNSASCLAGVKNRHKKVESVPTL